MLAKIDHLIEASSYDVDKLLAPYDLWPSHKSAELKEWMDSRAEEMKRRNAPPEPQSPYA